MKKILYSAIILALLPSVSFISGCKKAATIDGHVQTITNGASVATFTYDSQGRVSTFTDASGTITFTYSSNSVTVNDGGTATIFPLNNSGYATGNGVATYSYDNSGEWTTTVNGSTTTSYAYSNGDVTSVSSGSVTQSTATYLSTKDYRDFGIHFLGKNGASISNLTFSPRSVNLTSNAVSNSVTFQYSYTYDTKGRVSTETVTGGGTSSTSVYTYTTN